MSLGGMMSGAIDMQALIEQLKNSGGNVIVINPGSAAGVPMPPIGGGAMPPMPPMPDEGPEMISNGAPPALGGHADMENPMEDAGEAPGAEGAEDGGMMGAIKAGLAKSKKPKGPPSPGVGKGPKNPQTKAKSAKMPEKKSVKLAPKKDAKK